MKKIFLLSVLIIMINNQMFSSAFDVVSLVVENVIEVKEDYKNQQYPYYKNLKLEIKDLDKSHDLDLFYKENKIPILKPTLQNLFIGFGSGSKAQGKVISAKIYQISDAIVISTALGYTLIIGTLDLLTGSATSEDINYGQIFYTALLIEGVLHSIQALDSLIYGSIYNYRLKHDLNLIAHYNPNSNQFSLSYKFIIS